MNLQTLLAGLRTADPQFRLQAARIIGTLDEVDALDALRQQYRAESEAEVMDALQWAGQRLKAAQDAGYSTLEAIIAHFHIDVEFSPAAATTNDDEQARLREIQHTMEMHEIRAQEAAAKNEAMKRIARGGLLGLPGLMMASLPPTMDILRDTTALSGRVNLPQRRAMPTRPTDTDISILVRRLTEESSAEKRVRAAVDLAQVMNNPQALPHLARAFIEDDSAEVRQAAQGAARLIYWNAIYWGMEQDGSMAALIEQRTRQQVDSPAPASAASMPDPQPPEPPSTQPDVGEILRKAEEARRKRQRR